MKRLKIKQPRAELVENWRTQFIEKIEDQNEWIGSPEHNYSVELQVLDVTREPRAGNLQRLEDRITSHSDLQLYAFFADADPNQVNDQDREFDETLNQMNQKFNKGEIFHDQEAYLQSFYDIVPDVNMTEQYITDVKLKNLEQNLDAARNVEKAMLQSEDFETIYAGLQNRKNSNTALGAYQGLTLNLGINIGFEYKGDLLDQDNPWERNNGVYGRVCVDGDETFVDFGGQDIGFKEQVEEWIKSKYRT